MWTYLLLDVTFDWSTVYLDSRSIFTDAMHNSVQDLRLSWLESNDIESHVEDDIACGVLNYSFKIILLLKMVLPDVNDVAKLFCALSNEKLVDSL